MTSNAVFQGALPEVILITMIVMTLIISAITAKNFLKNADNIISVITLLKMTVNGKALIFKIIRHYYLVKNR